MTTHQSDSLREALEEIVNPIKFMRQRADAEGNKLDGHAANYLARDVSYLQNIARQALSAAPPLPDGGGNDEPSPTSHEGLSTAADFLGLHRETASLINRFAGALAAKLRRAEEKYGYTDGWTRDDWEAECRQHLVEHVAKGDPLDVAAYAAFCWAHGWSTSPPSLRELIIRPSPAAGQDPSQITGDGASPIPPQPQRDGHWREALEAIAWIVEASPLDFNAEGRLGRIGDRARQALASPPPPAGQSLEEGEGNDSESGLGPDYDETGGPF